MVRRIAGMVLGVVLAGASICDRVSGEETTEAGHSDESLIGAIHAEILKNPFELDLYTHLAKEHAAEKKIFSPDVYVKRLDKDDVKKASDLAEQGSAALKDKNYAQAKTLYEASIELNPYDSNVHSNLGVSLLSVQDNSGALDQFDICIILGDTDPVLRYNKGIASWNMARNHEKAKNVAESKIHYRQAHSFLTGYLKVDKEGNKSTVAKKLTNYMLKN